MEVIPISVPTINWTSLRASLGQLVCANIDSRKIKPEGHFAFFVGLGPKAVHHLYFSFLIFASNTVRFWMWQINYIKIEEFGDCTLYTASLFEWIRTICCGLTQKDTSKDQREILNRLLNMFEQAGYAELFNMYKKVDYRDGTFGLKSL